MNLQDLVRKAVDCLEKEYYTENDRERLVEYILDNSILTVSKDTVQLESYSLFGVGEDNKERDLPYFLDFILFSFCKSKEEVLAYRWKLKSFYTLAELEDNLSEMLDEGEQVVLIELNKQSFKRVESLKTINSSEIVWTTINPYLISYFLKNELIEESYPSKLSVEKRVSELYSENDDKLEGKYKHIKIENSIDDRIYEFTLICTKNFINGTNEEKEITFMWHPCYYIYDI